MPAENYVYLAGHGYDTIYIGYFAIRTYSSGLFIVTRSSPLDSWERMEAATGIFEMPICFSSY